MRGQGSQAEAKFSRSLVDGRGREHELNLNKKGLLVFSISPKLVNYVAMIFCRNSLLRSLFSLVILIRNTTSLEWRWMQNRQVAHAQPATHPIPTHLYRHLSMTVLGSHSRHPRNGVRLSLQKVNTAT